MPEFEAGGPGACADAWLLPAKSGFGERLYWLRKMTIAGRITTGVTLAGVLALLVTLGGWLLLLRQDQGFQVWEEYEQQVSGASENLSPETLAAWHEGMRVQMRSLQQTTRRDLMILLAVLLVGIVPLTAAALFFGRRISGALRDSAHRMSSLAEGKFDIDIPGTEREDELGEMARALQHFAEAMREVSEARDAMRRLSISDPLTQLLNRRGMDEKIASLLQADEPIAILTVMHVDLDHFKAINDTFGHDAGDHVLMIAARRMQQAVRSQDVVARVGGDEFVIMLPGLGDLGRLAQIASRVIGSLSQPIQYNGHLCQIGASIGIAIGGALHNATDPERLMKDADLAVFKSKANGRGRFSVFDHRMRALIEHQQMIANRLRRALDQNEIETCVQPLVSPTTGELLSVEALARWRDPSIGLVPAEDFVEVARQRNLLAEISAVVRDQAIGALATWPRDEELGPILSINLCTLELKDPHVVDHVRWALDQHGIPPERLALEVPAGISDVRGADRVIEVVARLRALGPAIWIDGFDPAMSAPGGLVAVGADAVKLDPKVFERCQSSPEAEEVLAAQIAQLHQVRCKVFAKALANDEMVESARRTGCDGLQGYAIDPPMALTNFEARLIGEGAKRRLDAAG